MDVQLQGSPCGLVHKQHTFSGQCQDVTRSVPSKCWHTCQRQLPYKAITLAKVLLYKGWKPDGPSPSLYPARLQSIHIQYIKQVTDIQGTLERTLAS